MLNCALCFNTQDKSLFVERVNENAMYNKTVIKFGFCDISNYQGCQKNISILLADDVIQWKKPCCDFRSPLMNTRLECQKVGL